MASIVESLAGVLYLLVGTLVFSIIVLALVWAASWIRGKLLKRFPKLSWIQSVFLSMLALVFILVFVLYFFPMASAPSNSVLDQPPDEPQDVLGGIANFLTQVARLLFVSLVFTILLVPLALLGDFVRQYVQKKRKKWIALLIASWCCVLVTVLIWFLFPWIPAGLVYFWFYS